MARRMFQESRRIVESRFLVANVFLIVLVTTLILRLWYLQIYRGDYYKQVSENNRIQFLEIPAPRGIVYDRGGQVVLGNRPYFDLVLVPQFVFDQQTTFKILSRLLHHPVSMFDRRMIMARGLPKYLPVTLKRNLTEHEVASIESNKLFLPGIDVAVAPRRDYKPVTPSHMVGYLGEISKRELERSVAENPPSTEQAYRAGDLIGKQGLEARWEKYLRGKRGSRLIQVDAYGRQAELRFGDHEAKGLNLPQVAASPGSDLILTLDMDLQAVTQSAFKGKNGSVVVLDPRNGEILAAVSEPGYDPNIYQGVLSQEKYRSLLANPFKPFLDKTTGGSFVPGSVFKVVVALAALEEGIIDEHSTYFCPGRYQLGGQTFHCHERRGHGSVNVRRALMKSCDVFFYNIGVELGVDRLAKYAQDLGLGQKLGTRLNFELPGLIPTTAWKKLTYRLPWTTGEMPSVAIGQGAVQLTPMQMATLYATIGNGGKIWRPHLVKRIVNHTGETVLVQDPELIRKVERIKPESFRLVKEGLVAVVMEKEGTGKSAAVEGHTVAGKTGSVQVVSLSKNRQKGEAVSMMWNEHAMFAAFSPAEDPEIAIAVVSEHDKVGGGGRSAAPVAGKILNAYYELKRRRAELRLSQGATPAASASKPGAHDSEATRAN